MTFKQLVVIGIDVSTRLKKGNYVFLSNKKHTCTFKDGKVIVVKGLNGRRYQDVHSKLYDKLVGDEWNELAYEEEITKE